MSTRRAALLGAALAFAALAPTRSLAQLKGAAPVAAPTPAASAPKAPVGTAPAATAPVDDELLEFLGSVGDDDAHGDWLEFLASTDVDKVARSGAKPPVRAK